LGQGVKAATLTVVYYPLYLPKDGASGSPNGTPIAFYYSLTGGAANQPYKLGAWIYDGTNSKGFIWDYSSSWVATGGSTTNYPIVTADGSGNLKGWVYLIVDGATVTNTNDTLRPRLYPQPSGSTISPSPYPTVTLMNMSSSGSGTLGGWI